MIDRSLSTLTAPTTEPIMGFMDTKVTLQHFYQNRRVKREEEARERRERYEALLPALVDGILERDPEVEKIILFGSLAEKKDGIVRDIDIALKSKAFLKVSGWLLSLAEPVDVVDINDLYPHIRKRVETRGRVLYERR